MTRSSKWLIASQVCASGSNFLFLAIAARSLGVEDFGVLALIYAVYVYIVQFYEAGILEPLVVKRSGGDHDGLVPAAVAAAGLSLGVLVSLASVAIACATGAAIPIWMIAGSPLLLIQYGLRYVALIHSRTHLAAFSDLIWLVGLMITFPVWLAGRDLDIGLTFALWVAPGAVAAIHLITSLSAWPSFRALSQFARDTRKLGPVYVAEALVLATGAQAVFILVAAVAGLPAAGGLRAAQSLFGPTSVLFSIIRFAGTRELVLAKKSRESFVARQRALFIGAFVVTALSGVVLVFLPEQLGTLIYGEVWYLAAPALPYFACRAVLISQSSVLVASLRALQLTKSTFFARVAGSLLTVGVSLGLAVYLGVAGAAAGLAIGETLTLLVLGMAYRRGASAREDW